MCESGDPGSPMYGTVDSEAEIIIMGGEMFKTSDGKKLTEIDRYNYCGTHTGYGANAWSGSAWSVLWSSHHRQGMPA